MDYTNPPLRHLDRVVDVMKMVNIAPRAGIKPISLAFRISVLINAQPWLPDVTTLPTHPCLCGSLPERSVQTSTLVSSVLKLTKLILRLLCIPAAGIREVDIGLG